MTIAILNTAKKNSKPEIIKNRGFSLVEVMVAMVIFSIGLLGLAGLQSLGVTNNQTAYFRTIAMQQAYNMADRMRDNITGVDAGNYDNITPANTPASGAFTNCLTASCTTTQLATFDHYEWNTNNSTELPAGRGSVERVGNQFVICVMWNELKLASPSVPDCKDPSAYDPTNDYKFYALRIEL